MGESQSKMRQRDVAGRINKLESSSSRLEDSATDVKTERKPSQKRTTKPILKNDSLRKQKPLGELLQHYYESVDLETMPETTPERMRPKSFPSRPLLPSTENLTNSPLADAEEDHDFEPSPTRTGEPTLKKESPRGQMRSHSVDYAIDIRVSPPQDSSDLHGTNTEDEFATDTNASSFQEHNIMYDLLERVKVMQQQVDELVGKQDEDAKESRESQKKIENMQKQLQDILSSRLPPPVPVNQYHHVQRSGEPLPLKAKSHSPPKQRPVNPPSPLVMPKDPSFEAFPALEQAKGRSERQRGGSQSSIASVVSVGDIQKRINNFERTLDTVRNMMSRLEGKKNQDSILRELTEIRSCVKNAVTMMLEKASVAGSPRESLSEEPSEEDRFYEERFYQEKDRFQEIYDEALKRGSVTVNRSRVIVVGKDGAGKSCLVDSLLNRRFERKKKSTEGAAVTMTHTPASDWEATDNKDYLDSLIAQGAYRMNQEHLTKPQSEEHQSEEHHASAVLEDALVKVHFTKPQSEERQASTVLKDALMVVGIEAKTLTREQQLLLNSFLKNKPSEEDLKRQSLGVRDIWDLGGQEVYLATHSALIPDNTTFGLSMYLIVMDISKSLSDKAESFHRSSDARVIELTKELGWIRTNGDFPLYWFGSITAAHEGTHRGEHWLGEAEEVDPPPVFVVGSHRDVLENDKQNFPNSDAVEKWLNEQGEAIEKLLNDSKFSRHIVLPKKRGDRRKYRNFREMVHFVKRIFLIDNSVSGSDSPCKTVNEIRERIDRMTSTYWAQRQKQPLFWVYLEIFLFCWKEVRKTVVAEVDEIVQLARHPKFCNISSREEVVVALKYLANVGAIFFYPKVNDLQNVVFTRPTWVIKALSAFVTAAMPGSNMEPQWNTLKNKGVLSKDLMDYRLKQIREDLDDADPGQIENENRLIVRLLQLLDIITPVSASPAEELSFYVPSMLRTSIKDRETHTLWHNCTLSEPPRHDFAAPLIVIPRNLKFVPECLYFRLLTRFLNLYPNRPRLSRHQGIFLVEDKISKVEVEVELLYHGRGKWVALTVHFVNKEDPTKISKHFLALIRSELCQQMKSVCQQGMRGFTYSVCCQTKKAVVSTEEFLRSLPLIKNEECEYSPNAKLYNPFDEPLAATPEEQSQINRWYACEDQPVSGKFQDVFPKEIDRCLIFVVAEQAAKANWTRFVVCLGREASDIQQYKEKYDEDFVRACAVIEDWKRGNGHEATVDDLITACERCGVHRSNIKAAYRDELQGGTFV